MAYFLKKTKSKKGIYLQIYQGYYCIEKKQPANKSFKPLGYVDALIKQGIEDPISYFQKEVDILNLEYQTTKKQDKASKITDISLIKKLGYFPIKSINDALKVESSINLIQSLYTPKFDAFNILSNLLYARLVYSNSKYKSYIDTIPSLFEKSNCNLDNIKIALDFFSEEYERITDIYNFHINNTHKFDTSITYFDCTNFYFEIDKKNSNNIISMALLLDKNQIPMSFKLFKANKTKDPIFHEVTKELQERSFVDTKTIYIADNGLKYAKNLYSIINNKDGYIYSKSFKSFNEMEKDWLFNPNNKFKEVKDKDGNLLYNLNSHQV